MALSHFNSVAIFRSSNEETSGSLCDRERFQIQGHDASLEQTADSQEKTVMLDVVLIVCLVVFAVA
jgi:hypothetical protein